MGDVAVFSAKVAARTVNVVRNRALVVFHDVTLGASWKFIEHFFVLGDFCSFNGKLGFKSLNAIVIPLPRAKLFVTYLTFLRIHFAIFFNVIFHVFTINA